MAIPTRSPPGTSAAANPATDNRFPGWCPSPGHRGRLLLPGDVGGMIVEDDLDCGCRRIGGIELFEKGHELARAMAFLDTGMNRTGQKIDAGQKAQRAVSHIFVVARE